jgi:hypothetical protein
MESGLVLRKEHRLNVFGKKSADVNIRERGMRI